MPDVRHTSRCDVTLEVTGPRLIAVGLAILIAVAWFPHLPVVTAISVITLGATSATSGRFRRSSALLPALALHAATYAALYALFVGATLDLAAKSTHGAHAWLVACDLAVSVLVMYLAAARITAAFRCE